MSLKKGLAREPDSTSARKPWFQLPSSSPLAGNQTLGDQGVGKEGRPAGEGELWRARSGAWGEVHRLPSGGLCLVHLILLGCKSARLLISFLTNRVCMILSVIPSPCGDTGPGTFILALVFSCTCNKSTISAIDESSLAVSPRKGEGGWFPTSSPTLWGHKIPPVLSPKTCQGSSLEGMCQLENKSPRHDL